MTQAENKAEVHFCLCKSIFATLAIKGIIAEQLGVDEDAVKMETHLMKDLEADSLDAVEIIMAIEDEFDIEVPDEDSEKFQTVSDIVNYVEAKA